MGKSRLAALLIAVVIVGVGVMRTATASHTTDHKAFSGGAIFKGLVVKTDRSPTSIATVDPTWQTVDSRGFQIPAGESQLIAVDFFAETVCFNELSQVCSARVLIGRTLAGATELEPAVGTDFILDRDGADVEGHSMSRTLCVRNATGSPANVTVWLEATKTHVDLNFLLDDWTFKIARNAPCDPAVNI